LGTPQVKLTELKADCSLPYN